MEAKAVKIGSEEFRQLAGLGENVAKALEVIGSCDLRSLPCGRHEIDGKEVYMNVVGCELAPAEESKFEAHDQYYDIHCPLTLTEGVGVKERSECTLPVGEFNSESDYILYDDKIEEIVYVQPGEIIIVGPEVSHAPCIGSGHQDKVIFKVRK